MLKLLSDRVIVKLATLFGLPHEDLKDKKEIQILREQLLEEKLKHTETNQNELIALQKKVNDLTADKFFLLEQENARLRQENQRIKQLAGPQYSALSYIPAIGQVDEFAYHEGLMKYRLKSGFEQTITVTPDELIGALSAAYPFLRFEIVDVINLYVTSRDQKINQVYPLYQNISTSIFHNFLILE